MRESASFRGASALVQHRATLRTSGSRGRSTLGPRQNRSRRHMDIERINGIGTLLAELTERTEQLRGYL
jgi:hypothetical protein